MDDEILKRLVKSFMQVNYCSSCVNNTSETHFLSYPCKSCLEGAYNHVHYQSLASLEVEEYQQKKEN